MSNWRKKQKEDLDKLSRTLVRMSVNVQDIADLFDDLDGELSTEAFNETHDDLGELLFMLRLQSEAMSKRLDPLLSIHKSVYSSDNGSSSDSEE